ncbi:hypothetical protein AB0392_15115 [Nonomuraea angiospora]|uniref:hypothetical protein n=1 Tax=Nonomuraea angiospora TaxID=46172 RepID=UPI00344D082C
MRAESDLAAIRAARKALDEVIDDIRAVPGYEGFLASPAFDDVVRAARRCPLVYLAAGLGEGAFERGHGGLLSWSPAR